MEVWLEYDHDALQWCGTFPLLCNCFVVDVSFFVFVMLVNKKLLFLIG